MFKNPFTPTFGGKPDFFFGRRDVLARFDGALSNRGSADRVLFVTGNRGCGKTALLEQFSRRAAGRGWTSVDVNSENALETLVRRLERSRSTTKTIAPELEVRVFGSGAKAGGVGSSRTKDFPKEDVEIILEEACKKNKKGLLLTIDEVQKISLDDLSLICGAFQMASRKGHDVMLAVAGLPYAYESVIQHEGCTYMRRSSHVRLGVFTHDEAKDAFVQAFAGISGLSVSDAALSRLVQASYGHPYVIQLLGYCLVERANAMSGGNAFEVSGADVAAVLPEALRDYEVRSLEPILNALAPSERRYLEAMARCARESHRARAGEVAADLGKRTQQVSSTKQRLVDAGIIVSVGHGEAMFNIPYLRDYLLRKPSASNEAALAQEWMF